MKHKELSPKEELEMWKNLSDELEKSLFQEDEGSAFDREKLIQFLSSSQVSELSNS